MVLTPPSIGGNPDPDLRFVADLPLCRSDATICSLPLLGYCVDTSINNGGGQLNIVAHVAAAQLGSSNTCGHRPWLQACAFFTTAVRIDTNLMGSIQGHAADRWPQTTQAWADLLNMPGPSPCQALLMPPRR
jgi:hypothetical protein